jgi:hypothetical protein
VLAAGYLGVFSDPGLIELSLFSTVFYHRIVPNSTGTAKLHILIAPDIETVIR